nr:hypothetical protein [Tanacetum cinerariifolium]
MVVRVPPVMSPGLSAGIAEVVTMSDSAFRKRFSEEDEEVEESLDSDSESEDVEDEGPTAEDEDPVAKDEGLAVGVEGPGLDDESYGLDDESHGVYGESYGLDDESHGIDDEGRGIDDEGRSIESDGLGLREEEAVTKGQQRAVLVIRTAMSEPLGLGYEALRRQELASEGDHVYSTFEVGQGSGSAPELEKSERVPAFRQPTLTTWTDLEDDMIYIDVPVYPPPVPPVQTPPSPEWMSGSLPISPSLFVVPSPVSSPMIPLTVPSPIATSTTTILVDEDQFIEIDRDVRELYTRSWAVRDEIFSQRYQFRSLEHKQERTAITFRALWRPVLASEAWAV